MIWLNIGLSIKITKIRTTPVFFEVDLRSATSMESSRRDFLNDMAEQRSTLKNNQHTFNPVMVSYQKQLSHSPKTGLVFTVYISKRLRSLLKIDVSQN